MPDKERVTNRRATEIDIRDLCNTLEVVEGLELSRARLEGHIRDRHFVNVKFNGCDFDRSIACHEITFERCVFSRAKLGGDFIDCEFEDCDFSGSTFKGFHNEYGFARCKFSSCGFEGCSWRRPYFKTVEFHNCGFDDAGCVGAFVSGFKTYGTHPESQFFKDSDIKSIFRDGEKLASP